MYRVLLTVLLLPGCGRIGFDPPLDVDERQDALATDGTATGGSADANLVCPTVQPTCELCGDLVAECTYGSVCCACVAGTWNCSLSNPVECPVNPPATGTGCVTEGLYCTYCPFRAATCSGGMWTGDAVGC